jgi:hypothetical protein
VRVLQATLAAVTATGCLVDFGTSRVPAALGTSFMPEIGEVVWVWNIDDWYLIMGPAAPKPDRGTVVSVASGIATLNSTYGPTVPGPVVTAPYVGTTPSAGQVMKLVWHGGPFAMLMSTSPAANPTPPGGGSSGPISHSDEFPAIDSGSYGSRWFTSQVYASDHNLGAWFYGPAIPDTIPAGASIQRVDIYIGAASQISGSAPNFATHGYQTKPGGAPSLSTVGAVGVAPGWVNLGSVGISIGNALKNGGGAYGVGLNTGGYNIFPSLAQDGYSGRLRITSVY